jgi:endonuclease G
MRATIICLIFLSVLFPSGHAAAENYPEIQCKHFFYGYPTGTPQTNNLIVRDAYALSSNDETKFADWVAYRLDKETITGDVETKRNWKADPWLSESETLEPEDYKGANKALNVDRRHQAPSDSFKGTSYWADTNYLSNITPQKTNLNQAWKRLEDRVRQLVKDGHVAYVMTGPLYEREMPSLPNADEPHKIPSGYWKIIFVQEGDFIKAFSFIFDQETGRSEKVIDHLTTVDEVEERSGLDFLRELPDDVEERIEGHMFMGCSKKHFE